MALTFLFFLTTIGISASWMATTNWNPQLVYPVRLQCPKFLLNKKNWHNYHCGNDGYCNERADNSKTPITEEELYGVLIPEAKSKLLGVLNSFFSSNTSYKRTTFTTFRMSCCDDNMTNNSYIMLGQSIDSIIAMHYPLVKPISLDKLIIRVITKRCCLTPPRLPLLSRHRIPHLGSDDDASHWIADIYKFDSQPAYSTGSQEIVFWPKILEKDQGTLYSVFQRLLVDVLRIYTIWSFANDDLMDIDSFPDLNVEDKVSIQNIQCPECDQDHSKPLDTGCLHECVCLKPHCDRTNVDCDCQFLKLNQLNGKVADLEHQITTMVPHSELVNIRVKNSKLQQEIEKLQSTVKELKAQTQQCPRVHHNSDSDCESVLANYDAFRLLNWVNSNPNSRDVIIKEFGQSGSCDLIHHNTDDMCENTLNSYTTVQWMRFFRSYPKTCDRVKSIMPNENPDAHLSSDKCEQVLRRYSKEQWQAYVNSYPELYENLKGIVFTKFGFPHRPGNDHCISRCRSLNDEELKSFIYEDRMFNLRVRELFEVQLVSIRIIVNGTQIGDLIEQIPIEHGLAEVTVDHHLEQVIKEIPTELFANRINKLAPELLLANHTCQSCELEHMNDHECEHICDQSNCHWAPSGPHSWTDECSRRHWISFPGNLAYNLRAVTNSYGVTMTPLPAIGRAIVTNPGNNTIFPENDQLPAPIRIALGNIITIRSNPITKVYWYIVTSPIRNAMYAVLEAVRPGAYYIGVNESAGTVVYYICKRVV
jgi:hypothetical protein